MSNPFEDLRQAVVVRPISSSIVVIRPANSPGPQGPSGPELKIQYPANLLSWHDVPAENDMYVRFSTNNGRSWGEPLLISNLTGGVIGPESSVDGNIAVFDGATGKVIKDAGFEPIKGPNTSVDGSIAVFDGATGKMIKDSGFVSGDYNFVPIGVPIPVWDHLSIDIPPNSGSGAIFIKLTAGESGEGGYNYGLLTGETVSGSAPLVEAIAIVDLLDSPLYGQAVHLINTEEAFLRARTTSGELQMDQMQRITGKLKNIRSNYFDSEGMVSIESGIRGEGTGDTATSPKNIVFDSANSPNARVSSTTSGETRSKNVSATWYLRIR